MHHVRTQACTPPRRARPHARPRPPARPPPLVTSDRAEVYACAHAAGTAGHERRGRGACRTSAGSDTFVRPKQEAGCCQWPTNPVKHWLLDKRKVTRLNCRSQHRKGCRSGVESEGSQHDRDRAMPRVLQPADLPLLRAVLPMDLHGLLALPRRPHQGAPACGVGMPRWPRIWQPVRRPRPANSTRPLACGVGGARCPGMGASAAPIPGATATAGQARISVRSTAAASQAKGA